MIKILISADSAAVHSGFAKVVREIFIPLHKTGKYEIEQIGWFHYEDIEKVPWKIYSTKSIQTANGKKLTKDDQHGEATTYKIIESFKPDIIWTCGDPWMLKHMVGLKNNYDFNWVSQVYIDGCVYHNFPKVWNYSDALVPVTNFGYQILSEIDEIDKNILCDPIYCGVNTSTYKPLPHKEIENLKKTMIETSRDNYKNPMVIGYVGRNQRRKIIPGFHIMKSMVDHNSIFRCRKCRMINAPNINYEFYYNKKPKFYLNKCRHCGSEKLYPEQMELIFWLHCPPGDRGWGLTKLESMWDIEDKIMRTANHEILKGIPESDFAKVFNVFDIYLSMATEGFGLPLLEAMACGKPVISPNFAASAEFMKQTDLCWNPEDCYIEDGTCIPRPLPNYTHIFNLIDKLADKEFYKNKSQQALDLSKKYTWDKPVKQWDRLFEKLQSSDSTPLQIY